MKKNNILALTLSAGLVLGGAYLVEANQNVAYAQEDLSIDVEIPRKEAEIDGLKKEIAQKNYEISNLENQKEDTSKDYDEYDKIWPERDKLYKEYLPILAEYKPILAKYKAEVKKLNELYEQWKAANDAYIADPNNKELEKKKSELAFKWGDQEKITAEAKKAYDEYLPKIKPLSEKLKELDKQLDQIQAVLDEKEAKNKEIEEKIEKINKEKEETSEKIKNLEEEISQIKKNKAIVREILGDEADVVGYNYRSVETTKDSDKKEEMGISAETRAKLLEAIRQAEIKIEAVRFLKENTPKTIAKVVDKLDKLVAEQEMLIKEAKEILAKY